MASDSFEERRQRIIKHLNRDHQPELSRYLEHFASLPRDTASSNPQLIDVSLDRLLIRAGDGSDYSVPFVPPLSSWDEIRSRTVAMDAAARAALGGPSSNITLTEYAPPQGFGAFVFGAVLFYFFSHATLPWVQPGTAAWSIVSTIFPGGPLRYRWVVKSIFWPVIMLHTAEAVIMDLTRLRKHGVSRGSRVWWLWVTNCWVEGITTFKRIDGVIAAKRAQQGGKTK
jgi:hypothetical protein